MQESVISTIIKFCLKSLQEFVRLQTFNRSGFQQIQLDIEFLKNPLKEFVDDDAAIDFLLKEVITCHQCIRLLSFKIIESFMVACLFCNLINIHLIQKIHFICLLIMVYRRIEISNMLMSCPFSKYLDSASLC